MQKDQGYITREKFYIFSTIEDAISKMSEIAVGMFLDNFEWGTGSCPLDSALRIQSVKSLEEIAIVTKDLFRGSANYGFMVEVITPETI